MENIALEHTDMLTVFGTAMLRGDDDEPVSTDHLLVSLASAPGTREIMDAAQLTRTVVASVRRRRHAEWASDDRGGPVGIVIAEGGTPADFSVAAAEALRRAARTAGPDGCDSRDVLLAILDDPDCRAAALLADCAAPVAALRESLRDRRPLRIADPVPRELHRVRDLMIGRTRYPRVPFWRNPLLMILAPARVDLVPHPLAWLMLETREQARERGHRKPTTDDALLAMLAMYETARLYPHLYRHTAAEYDGVTALAEAGARYAELRAQTAALGEDPRPLRRLLPDHPGDLRTVVRSLIGDTRAGRLLTAAGVEFTPS
jgi:hypothetical protein